MKKFSVLLLFLTTFSLTNNAYAQTLPDTLSFMLSPNPAYTELNITTNGVPRDFILFDMLGVPVKKIGARDFNKQHNTYVFKMSVIPFTRGCYFLQGYVSGYPVTRKLYIER